MKFSESWLREWVNPTVSSEQLAEQLTMAGLEVDDVSPVAGQFSGVVIGRVVACQPHPNADKLCVTKVDIGAPDLLNIVCGAPNCRQGLTVACATIGAVLPGDFKIKAAKLRGEPSEGMLCSFSELGMSDDHSGIIELPADAPLGTNVRQYLKLDDVTIDISVTPNRADCFGLCGIARDISAVNNINITEPHFAEVDATIEDTLAIQIDEPQAAPRYLGRVVRNIDIRAKSPIWLKEKLRRCGIRAIDPVVDVTNYVLIELGHPMHAFDLKKINGGIVVRYAKPGETLVLLDGNEVKLLENTLVIADHQQVLALAGIFGGAHSGVTSATCDILLEAAFFAPAVIAGKAREYGLHTDASHRYERGVDPALQYKAMARASELILSICGGEAGPVIDVTYADYLPNIATIHLRRSKLDSLIGYSIESQKVTDILQRLGCQVTELADSWQVTAPSWRFDLTIEADLVEEVVRIYGYNNIPNRHLKIELEMKAMPESTVGLARVKTLLVDRGYQEAVTYSFVDPKIQSMLHPNEQTIDLPNPISAEMSSMRLSLWSGLLSAALYNQNRQQTRVRLFESGLRFIPDESAEFGIRQETVLSGVITGNLYEEHWQLPKQQVDFFDIKGDVSAILALTRQQDEIYFKLSKHSTLHPGQNAALYVGNELIGFIGVLHPEIEKKLGLNGRTVLFELLWDKLAKGDVPKAKEISRFPSNRRDIAIIVNNDIAAADIIDECVKVAGNQLVNINLFDVYQGVNIKLGQKSLAISLILQDTTRTLEEDDITTIVNKCIHALQIRFNALLRE